uniref:Uncharacterized protein n=1 Tax=Anguilla anguilla TaxID=7936 RepID=A0A0E9UJW7_ANGAN
MRLFNFTAAMRLFSLTKTHNIQWFRCTAVPPSPACPRLPPETAF